MIEDNSLGLEFKYLIVNDMDRKFGLWVNTVGYQSIPPDSPYPLKEHPSGYFFNAEKEECFVSINWYISPRGVVCFHLILPLKSKFVKVG